MVIRVTYHHDHHLVLSGSSFELETHMVHSSEECGILMTTWTPGPCFLSECLWPGETDLALYILIFLAFLFKF